MACSCDCLHDEREHVRIERIDDSANPWQIRRAEHLYAREIMTSTRVEFVIPAAAFPSYLDIAASAALISGRAGPPPVPA
jgi:hypothetical protein